MSNRQVCGINITLTNRCVAFSIQKHIVYNSTFNIGQHDVKTELTSFMDGIFSMPTCLS